MCSSGSVETIQRLAARCATRRGRAVRGASPVLLGRLGQRLELPSLLLEVPRRRGVHVFEERAAVRRRQVLHRVHSVGDARDIVVGVIAVGQILDR